ARGRAAVALRGRRTAGVGRRGSAAGVPLRPRRREGARADRGARSGVDHRDRARGRRRDPRAGLRADALLRGVLGVRVPDCVPGGGEVTFFGAMEAPPHLLERPPGMQIALAIGGPAALRAISGIPAADSYVAYTALPLLRTA